MFCSNCGHKLEQDAQFCGNCGTQIAPLSYTIAPETTSSSKSNASKYFIIAFGFIVVGVLAFLAINKSKSDYNFEGTYSEEIVEVEEEEEPSSLISEQFVKTDGESTKKGAYGTAIIYDNTYSGVNVTDKEVAYSLIKEDSTIQKKNCPKDILSIENSIINNYGIKAVNLCEMDLDFAKDIEAVFRTIYNEYPGARGYLTNLTLYNENDAKQANIIAAFSPLFMFESSTESAVFKMQIILNSAYFLNPKRIESGAIANSDAGWFPKNSTRYSPVAHELGHYLSFIAMLKHHNVDSVLIMDLSSEYVLYEIAEDFSKGEYSYDMIQEAYGNYKNDYDTDLSIDEWRGKISGYALAKDDNGNYIYDETIAEAFHDVFLNKEDASLPSIYVVNVLKSRLEG